MGSAFPQTLSTTSVTDKNMYLCEKQCFIDETQRCLNESRFYSAKQTIIYFKTIQN
jgi:putative lipase involved disintegration of autophagic bodies